MHPDEVEAAFWMWYGPLPEPDISGWKSLHVWKAAVRWERARHAQADAELRARLERDPQLHMRMEGD